jgi:hypothetical protein
MKRQAYVWVFGLLATGLIVIGTLLLLAVPNSDAAADPWSNMPVRAAHTEYSDLLAGPFGTGQQVTARCLACHADASHEMMQTTHWTWQAPPVEVEWRDEPVSIGKANTINNFCDVLAADSYGPAGRECFAVHQLPQPERAHGLGGTGLFRRSDQVGWSQIEHAAGGSIMKRLSLILFLMGVLCLSAAATLAQGSSDLHPTFPLLDADGVNVLESGGPVSTMQTCGTCHDTGFIAEHSAHADVGFSLGGSVSGGRKWGNGFGWYGGWNPITYAESDLTAAEWVQQYGWRHVGGGPAAGVGVEMNCFICHLPEADNAARPPAKSTDSSLSAACSSASFCSVRPLDCTKTSGTPHSWDASR